MTSIRRLLAIGLLAAALPGVAEEGVRSVPTFRHDRTVRPGAPGPNRLDVDVPLLAGSEARSGSGLLSDLRFHDSAGREVPYLLVLPRRAEPEWYAATLLPIAATKTASGFEADLGALRRVDRLRVSGIPAPFLKRLRLEGSGDRARWTLLADEGTLFDLPEEGLSRTVVAFPAGEHRFLRLVWNDAKSGRVPLPSRVEARAAGTGGSPEPLRAQVPFERRESEPGRSRYRLRLPAAGLPISALEVGVRSGNVLREARVLESRLAAGRLVPYELGAATLRRAEREDAAAAEMAISVAPPTEAELELVVEDAGNPSLELASVTALFEGLPFVYFESADGAPLAARYGAPGLERPRYDLEAARPAVTRRGAPPPSSAVWGEERPRPAPAAEASGPPPVPAGAALDRRSFRVSRPIPPGPPGLTALRLDAAVLAESPSLADVRIVSSDDRQVPYLLETLGEPLVVRLPAPRPADDPRPRGGEGSAGRLSFQRIDLPYETLPAARLELATSARVFARNVVLYRERLGGRPETSGTFTAIASSAWQSADPSREAPRLLLELPPGTGGTLFVSIDDGDNAPIPLSGASLLLPAHRLRFVREAGELALLVGRPGLAAPRYDLELLAPRLLGAPATEAELAPAPLPVAAPSAGAKLFWAALVGAVVALLVLLARLLRRPAGPAGSEAAGGEG